MKNQRLAGELASEIRQFLDSRLTLSLAVVQANGAPIASYAPFVEFDGGLFILVSELAQHTQALKSATQASVMIMADEGDCDTVYARRRLQYDMHIEPIARDSAIWQTVSQALLTRHGDVVTQLLELSDFNMFKFEPMSGRYVKGFGRAYELPENVLVGEPSKHLRG